MLKSKDIINEVISSNYLRSNGEIEEVDSCKILQMNKNMAQLFNEKRIFLKNQSYHFVARKLVT